MIYDILPFVHHVLRQHIQAGDTVVDATAGNGHDTLLLAQCVGQTGKVLAFDVQTQALAATQARLLAAQAQQQVELIHASHAQMAVFAPDDLSAVVFNLGYLPHGNKRLTTQPESSLLAIQDALNLLKINGLLVCVIYHGHETGKQEKSCLMAFFAQLPSQQYRVLQYGFVNRHHAPPFVVLVQKAA